MAAFTLEESARRLGHFRWLEQRLFEMMGAWVADTADTDLKLAYAACSRFHGWHAQLLEERLPEVRELSPARQTVPPSSAFADMVADLAGLDGPDRELERVVAIARVVVPHLVAAYEAHLDRCTPVADASVIRTIGFILADGREQLATLEGVASAMSVDPDAAARADEAARRFGALLGASGGISGV